MTKEELLTKIIVLLGTYETENDNCIVECEMLITENNGNPEEKYLWNGQEMEKTR